MSKFKAILTLSKIRITFAVGLTVMTGYVLGKGSFDWLTLWVSLGLFILACGSAILNQYQEVDLDRKMDRTNKRPIPAGIISEQEALMYALLFVAAGSILLYVTAGLGTLAMGLLALVWYNLIYTPLKRVTPYAFIPGAVIGAIPPLAAWVAAGRSLLETEAMLIGFFFFIWQIPHFWLLFLKYRKQYAEAGFPALKRELDESSVKMITFVWILATAISAMMLPVFGATTSLITAIGILVATVWLVFTFSTLLKPKKEAFVPFKYFMKINVYVLGMIILLTIDRFI
jgi:protoheme IX farnesyltransferase